MRAQKNIPEQLKLSDFEDKSLLILDDDDPLRGRLARAMEKKGFQVKEAKTVAEGLNFVKTTPPGFACNIGKFVTVGHMAMLHGCEIGDGSLIGIGSVILNGAKIGKNCIIGAKALITEGMEVPDGSMVLGIPAKVKKELTLEEQEIPSLNAHHYIENYKRYKAELG